MRKKIVALSLVIASLAIGAFGVPLAVGLSQLAVAEATAELRRLADLSARTVLPLLHDDVLPRSAPGADSDTAVGIYDEDGIRITGSGPENGGPPVERALDGRPVQEDDGTTLVAVVPVLDEDGIYGAARAVRPLATVYQRLMPAWLGMLGLAALVLLAVWLVARRSAGRLARPLEDLAARAVRLGDGDFSVRTRPVGVPEIDAVDEALAGTAARLDALLTRERAFSVEASHQLRTPLSGLRMRLEAALEHPDDDPRGVLTDGLASADRLERTIDELLLLAGEAERTRGEQVDLQALVQEIGAEWTPRLAAQDRVLECRVTHPLPSPRLSTAAARQILTVLLDNAEAHGAGTVRIEVRESTDAVAVDVSDEGAGPDPASGPFDRRPGPGGHGIGLGLARRIAEAEGGRLVLTHPPRRCSPCSFSPTGPTGRAST